jgi:hemerythrin
MTLPYVVWKEFYSVGNQELDQQHKALLKMINDLFTAAGGNAGRQVIEDVLDRLCQYTRTHFQREESLMWQARFPEYAAHKAVHDLMRAETDRLRQAWTDTTGAELLTFLKEWWLNHICAEDKRYAPFLTQEACPA